jgi:hypothetical protein
MSKNANYIYPTLAMSSDIIFRGMAAKRPGGTTTETEFFRWMSRFGGIEEFFTRKKNILLVIGNLSLKLIFSVSVLSLSDHLNRKPNYLLPEH